jgi:RND family efflux transporter MFP subunit
MLMTRLKAAGLAAFTLTLAMTAAWGLTPAPVVRAGPDPSAQDPSLPQPAANRKLQGDSGSIVLEAVKRVDLTRKSTLSTHVEPDREVELYSRVSGFLREMNVALGDHVKAGQVLAGVDSPDAVAEVERNQAMLARAGAEVKRAQSSLRVAQAGIIAGTANQQAARAALARSESNTEYRRKALARMEALVKQGSVEQRLLLEAEDQAKAAESAREAAKADVDTAAAGLLEAEAKMDQAAADVEQAKANVQVVEAGLKKAKALLDSAVIRSPFDGTVSACRFHVGDFVRSPSQGAAAPVCTIIKTDAVSLLVQVADRDAVLLKPGAPATVLRHDAKGEHRFQGKIDRIAPTLVTVTGTRDAEIVLPNQDGELRAGQFANVEITLEVVSGAITIPAKAVVTDQGSKCCFRVVEGRIVRTPVTLGMREGDQVQVLEGLREGEAVVANPTPKLKDGQSVESAVTK